MRDIGVDVKIPSGEWDGDANCPFYGSLRLRGQMLEGTISSVGMSRTITIERHNVRYMQKYERFEKRTSARFRTSCPPVSEKSTSVIRSRSWNADRSIKDGFILRRRSNSGGEDQMRGNCRYVKPVVYRPQHACTSQITPVQRLYKSLNVLKLGGNTMRRYPAAGVGDLAKVSVKKGTPDTRRQMFNAVIIRQRRPFRRVDGTWVQFEDNACVIAQRERRRTRVPISKGPVSREAAETLASYRSKCETDCLR